MIKFGLFLIINFCFIWRVRFSLHLRERKLDFFLSFNIWDKKKKRKIACVFNHYNWNYYAALPAYILSANPEGPNVYTYTKNGQNKRPEKKTEKAYPLLTCSNRLCRNFACSYILGSKFHATKTRLWEKDKEYRYSSLTQDLFLKIYFCQSVSAGTCPETRTQNID